jgi:YD repeat-containing protein
MEINEPLGASPLTNEYDADGRLIAQIDANGNHIEYTHNIAGREELILDSRGNTTRFLYDTRGNVLSEEKSVTIEGTPVLAKTTYLYDSEDNIIEQVGPDGLKVVTTYDSNDNPLTVVKDPGGLNLTTGFTYNASGDILILTDAAGNTTEYT